jgi:hypothetical protein
MAKRLIDSNLFQKDWFLELESKYQVLYIYIFTHCDVAGIFDPNLRTISKLLNKEFLEEEVLSVFADQLIKIHDKWVLTKFIKHQYGISISPKMIKPVTNALAKIGLEIEDLDTVSIEYQYSSDTAKRIRISKEIRIENKEGVIGGTNLEPIDERKSECSGPDFNDVKIFFLDNKRPVEEAIIFWSEYESKNWIIESDTGPPRSIKKTKQWQLKAEQWIQKARLKDMEKNDGKGKQTGTTFRKFAKGSTSIEDINAGLDKAFGKTQIGTG